MIFVARAARAARAQTGYRLHEQLTGEQGRVTPARLDELCADWRERETFLCGPAGLLEAMGGRWARDGDRRACTWSTSSPTSICWTSAPGSAAPAARSASRTSGIEVVSDGEQPILACGEGAGAELPFGCRMGICHTCVGRLRSGQVRDLRTGRVHGQPGEMVQTCINAPEGAVEIDL